MRKWRVVENEWNLGGAPWAGAIGIEEVEEELAVPAVVCWFCRTWPLAPVQHVVDLHNWWVDEQMVKE